MRYVLLFQSDWKHHWQVVLTWQMETRVVLVAVKQDHVNSENRVITFFCARAVAAESMRGSRSRVRMCETEVGADCVPRRTTDHAGVRHEVSTVPPTIA